MALLQKHIAVAILIFGLCVANTHGWGQLFNRFSSDMLENLGYGRGSNRHYPYGQDPEEIYSNAIDGSSNRIEDVMEEANQCYSSACITNGGCCPGYLCLNTEEGGRCLPAFAGRKLGEMCTREDQCDAGLICEEVVPGEMPVCRMPSAGKKQFNEDCNESSECDITRGLCCMIQRRHRQKARKICSYFKEPLTCIGPVATDQIKDYLQHTEEKRIAALRMH